MKLTVRIKDTPTGRHLVLCDERGNILPMQRSVEIADEVGGLPMLTVQFLIDGEEIALAKDE